jgi:hypothetical protein
VKAVVLAFVGIAITGPALGQPSNTQGPETAPSNTANPVPGVQRMQIIPQTRADHEAFLKRRRMQLEQENIQPVPPLPAQQVSPAPGQRQ